MAKFVTGCRERGTWWFRIRGGYGLHWKNTKLHPLVFSERQRLVPHLAIGNWSFKLLRPYAIALFLLFSASVASAQQAHYGHDGPAILPDPNVTPGVIRTSDESEICNPKFRTKPWRKTTQAMKNHVYAAYGVERNKGMCRGGCEVDHRLPLELGGLDDERNLWPQPSQPLPGFHQKDKLENALKKAVCKDHSMSLAEAQKALMGDWYTAYLALR